MDALVTNEIAVAGDLLMSRFCAVETSLNAAWKVAQHMERFTITPCQAPHTPCTQQLFANTDDRCAIAIFLAE